MWTYKLLPPYTKLFENNSKHASDLNSLIFFIAHWISFSYIAIIGPFMVIAYIIHTVIYLTFNTFHVFVLLKICLIYAHVI